MSSWAFGEIQPLVRVHLEAPQALTFDGLTDDPCQIELSRMEEQNQVSRATLGRA